MKAYLEPEDIQLMERNAVCIRDRLLVRLLFRLGCRVSELLAIRVSDIDFNRATITIVHLKKRDRLTCPKCRARLGVKHHFCPDCGEAIDEAVKRQHEQHRVRILPIDRNILNTLREYIISQGLITEYGDRFLFDINRHRAWQIVKDCAEKVGLPKLVNPETGRLYNVSPHRLRDAFAVHAVKVNDSGDGLRLLQEHLGHASFNTTAKYRKVSGKEQHDWFQKLWK